MTSFGFGAPATKSFEMICGYVFGPDPVIFLQEVFDGSKYRPEGVSLTIRAGKSERTSDEPPEFHSGNLVVTIDHRSTFYQALRDFRGSLRLSDGKGVEVILPATENFVRLTRACDDMRVRYARNWAENRDPE